MKDQPSELQLIRRALLQAAEEDYKAALASAPEAPPFSAKYRRWEKGFLRDPARALRAAARPQRPQWQRALRAVACFLLAVSVIFGAVLAASPAARATVIRWFTREFDTHTAYQFEGYVLQSQMGRWGITDLPEGYKETEVVDLENMVRVIYSNGNPEVDIEFDYQLLTNGSGENLDNEWHTVSDVSILGMPGQLFTSIEEDGINMVLWFDEGTNHSFLIMSRLEYEVLLQMAESAATIE